MMSAFILQNIRERMSLNHYLYNCEPYDLETENLFELHLLDLSKIEFSNSIFFPQGAYYELLKFIRCTYCINFVL